MSGRLRTSVTIPHVSTYNYNITLDEFIAYAGRNTLMLATKTGNFKFAKVKFDHGNYEQK